MRGDAQAKLIAAHVADLLAYIAYQVRRVTFGLEGEILDRYIRQRRLFSSLHFHRNKLAAGRQTTSAEAVVVKIRKYDSRVSVFGRRPSIQGYGL